MIFRCYHEMSSISPENILQLIFGSKFFQVVYFLFHTIFTIDFNGFLSFSSCWFHRIVLPADESEGYGLYRLP